MMIIIEVRYVYLSQNRQIINFYPVKSLKLKWFFFKFKNIFNYNITIMQIDKFFLTFCYTVQTHFD